MCGIVGVFALGEAENKTIESTRQKRMQWILTEMLQSTQVRGTDATGVATLYSNGDYHGLKMGISALELISRFGKDEGSYEHFINLWDKNKNEAVAAIGHCRKTSVGGVYNNNNNHPIKVGEIIGVHNGTLKNHDQIIKNLGNVRDGQVDSEAIFRLVHRFTENGKIPFTTEILEEIANRLDGTYACLAMSGNNPYQIGAFRDDRPIEFLLLKSLGILVVGSESGFLKHLVFSINKEARLYTNPLFPKIAAADVELKSTANETVMVINLINPVVKETTISDIVETKYIYKNKKVWLNKPATQQAVQSTKATTVVKGTVFGQNKTVVVKKDEGKRVYDETLGKYVTQVDENEASKLKNVVVPIEHGAAVVTIPAENKATKNTECKIVDESSELKVTTPGTKNVVPDSLKTGKKIDSVKEVDMKVDTDALEISKSIMKELTSYGSDEEAANDLELADIQTLRTLPMFALANRIRRTTYSNGAYSGVLAYKKIQKLAEKESKSTCTDKTATAETKLRCLKVFTGVIASVLSNSLGEQVAEEVEQTVSKAFEEGLELKSKVLDGIFSSGDHKRLPIVGKAISTIKTIEQGKE